MSIPTREQVADVIRESTEPTFERTADLVISLFVNGDEGDELVALREENERLRARVATLEENLRMKVRLNTLAQDALQPASRDGWNFR